MEPGERVLRAADEAVADIDRALANHRAEVAVDEVGTISALAPGVVRVVGLAGVCAEELLEFSANVRGMVFDITATDVGVVLLDHPYGLSVGDQVRRSGRVVDVPIGDAMLGRVIDPLGRARDGLSAPADDQRWPIERPAPPIMDRAPVTEPLATGVTVIDALVPIGRGQRELILGDRQSGKTALAVAAIRHQRDSGVRCIYCATGQRTAAVAQVVANLRDVGALAYTTVVVASGDDPPGLQCVAPFAAATIAEAWAAAGHDCLVVYDDLTSHARAYREVSLLLRRPPGREAFPGDIFYLHARLLERATKLRVGGS
ncbi:MAG: F0F1 ATP synthase subunit alpha, partial [Planctomycetota bacterium]